MNELDAQRAIVDLLPRYAHARRRGWTPTPRLHDRITLPAYVLLRQVATLRDDGPIPLDELHATLANPYCTVDSTLDQMPQLVALKLLDQEGNAYTLASAGHTLLMRGEHEANDYAAARLGLPSDDLARLAATLHNIAERQRLAPEPPEKAHQDRVPRLRRFDGPQTPPVLLEHALYALQRARDDAHIAAWQTAGFRGPPLELLSRIWAGDAATVAELVALTHDRMRPEDVTALLEELAHDGPVVGDGAPVTITDRGQTVSAGIERETDRG